jgi:hypothetical protein
MLRTDQQRKSRAALKDTPEDFPMRSSHISRHRRMGLDWLSGWTLALAVFGLSACATHRGDPPKCKGPFTPINPSSSVVSNGAQR